MLPTVIVGFIMLGITCIDFVHGIYKIYSYELDVPDLDLSINNSTHENNQSYRSPNENIEVRDVYVSIISFYLIYRK